MRRFLFTFSIILIVFAIFYTSLSAASPPQCTCEKDRHLKINTPAMVGDDIKELQLQLKNLGFYKGSINGIYDNKTFISVKAFQKAMGVIDDGIFGPASLERLAWAYLQSPEKWGLLPSNSPQGEAFFSEGEISLAIDALSRTLTVLVDGRPYKSYPVAVGKFSTPTPIGLFTIVHKDSWGEGFGTRWMQISVPWGVYGIHGTNKPWSIGGFESAGCIRMHNSHVEEIYDLTGIGTKVYIFGGIDGPFTFGMTTLTEGSKGSDVLEVQKRLEGLGYYSGSLDGKYGFSLKASVIDFQKEAGIEPSGNVDQDTYKALGVTQFE